jgi:hypothetical protein
MIRLQEYVRLLKCMVLVSAEEQAPEPHSVVLGKLMEVLDGSLPPGVPVSAHFRFEMPEDALDATEKGLAELLTMRDDLMHHFLQRFDIDQLDGCGAAAAWLDDCCARVDAQLLKLRVWAAVIDEARASLPLFSEMSEAEANDIAKYLEKFRRGAS